MGHRANYTARVSGEGYKWVVTHSVEEPDQKQHYLTTGQTIGYELLEPNLEVYDPFASRSLFMTFADVEPTYEGVLNFANRHGLLGGDNQGTDGLGQLINITADPDGLGIRQNTLGYGESLATWETEIQSMAEAIDLWRLLITKSLPTLHRRFEWSTGKRGPVLEYHPVWSTDGTSGEIKAFGGISHRGSRKGYWVNGFLVEEGDVVSPALGRVHSLVNERLRGAVTPALSWSALSEKPEFLYQVPNLRTALWFQLSEAICGKKEFRTCEYCGTWMELGSGKNNQRKRFCGNACKQKAYRDRLSERKTSARSDVKG